MTAIELRGLTKHYGDVTALEEVDLSVEEGEIFGFLGPNGAGKSTTIDILLDFVRPTSGEASVLGMDAQEETLGVRRRTGVLPDGFHIYDRLTGRQHIDFVVESKGADDDPVSVLERVGIADAADRSAGGYSKGMTQRLALGMALVGDPDLLILDEPSTGLDPAGAREIRDIVREESSRGTTIFFSSHVLSQVEAVCDRVGILRAGELIAVDTVEGLRDAAGTEARLRITADGIDDDALDAVRGLDGVSTVSLDGETLTVGVGDGSKTAVLNALEATGVTVRDFETVESSLEELFISYTEGER
ncbi:ABC transporter ATP-binding protein [Salinibaculum salinum]|uniref:ABC transporter ATP-binding protein n=1 Tax=Salinibaculum salinum TaxID=3131996 RepID=UPI0030EF8A8E